MASIQAISQDLKLAPNESLQENPNTLAVLKPLSSSAKHSQASGEEEVRNTAEARVKVTTSLDLRTQSSAAAPSGEDPSGVPAAQPSSEPEPINYRKKVLDSLAKDYFLYLKQAYQFSTTVSHSRLQLLEKQGKHDVSKLLVPQLLDSGLGVRSKLTGGVAPKHFIFTPMRANNIAGPGKGIQKFLRVARAMLLTGSKFVGNQIKLQTAPARLENRRWKFQEQRLVVRYDPEMDLKLYIEFNFEHQLSSSDRLGLGLNGRNATAQVTEGMVAWCLIPVSICSQIREETVVPVKLMTGPLTKPITLDDLRSQNPTGIQKKIQETCGMTVAGQATCYPSKQSLFTLKVEPMNYSSEDFRYLPANFISNVKLATVITLYQMILRDCLKKTPSVLNQMLDPVLATFPRILDDEMMMSSFLNIWSAATNKIEQVRRWLKQLTF